MKKIILLMALAAFSLSAAEVLNLSDLKRRGVSRNSDGNIEIAGVWLPVDNIPVTPRERLRITVNARVKSGNSVETNGAIETVLPSSVWSLSFMPWKLPVMDFDYKSAGGKSLKAQWHGAAVPIYSNQFRDYVMEFYVIDNAGKLRFNLRARDPKNILEVKSVTLERIDFAGEKYININPLLDYGKYNPAGYGYAHQCTMSSDGSGRNYLETGDSWLMGDCIPVSPGDKLRVSYGGEASGKKNRLNFGLNYFKSTSCKKSEKAGANRVPMRLSAKEKEGTQEFIVPAGASWLRISATGGTVHYIKIEKISGK